MNLRILIAFLAIFQFSFQVYSQAPNCATGLLPVDGGTLASPGTAFTWTAPGSGPAPTSYRISIGTSPGGTQLVNAATVTAPTTSYIYTAATPLLNCGTTYYWRVIPFNGATPAVGCVEQTFTLSASGDPTFFPIGTWNAYCYNSTNWTNYVGYYTQSGLNFDSRNAWTSNNQSPSRPVGSGGAAGYLGCALPVDNHSISYKRQGFTPGTYTLDIVHDDACFIFLNGTQIYTRTGSTGSFITSVWTGNLDASSQLEFRWTEGSGGSHGGINFTSITTPTLNPGIVAGNQTLCFGSSDPAAFTSTSAASGTCSGFTYQWQSSTGCTGTWSDIIGATNATYDAPSGLTQTTCYRRAVIDSYCGRTDYSNTITVTVYSTPPGDPSVFPSNSWTAYAYTNTNYTTYAGYYPAETGLDINSTTYWATGVSPSAATGYVGCPVGNDNHGVIYKREGFTPGAYQINIGHDDGAVLLVNGTQIYSAGCCPTNTLINWTGILNEFSVVEFRWNDTGGGSRGSLTFTSITTPTIVPGIIANNQGICTGENPTIINSVQAASGTCSPVSYQWQQDIGCTGLFSDISGATLVSYDPPVLTQTTCYRRKVVDLNCFREDFSNIVTITVSPTPPGDPAVFGLNTWNGYAYDFTSSGGYTVTDTWPTGAYRGFFTYEGVSPTDPSFNTVSFYTTASVPSSPTTYNGCQIPATVNGVQMKRQGFPDGIYQLNFLSDDAGYLYIDGLQVYGRINNGSATNVWTGRLGATSTVEFKYKNNGGPGAGQLTFVPTTITIPLNGGSIANSGATTICPGNAPSALNSTVAGTGTCTFYYQWQFDDGTGYIDIVGANSASYTPSSISVNTDFRRKVTDACGDIAYSNVITILVGPSSPPNPAIFGNNSWIAYVYNQSNYVPASLFGSYTDPGVSASNPSFNSQTYWGSTSTPSSASTYTGCQVGIDNHSVIYKRQGFPTGTYSLNVLHDDPGQIYVDGVLVYNNGAWTPAPLNGVWIGNLGATSTIEFRWSENAGGSYGALDFLLITTPSPLNGGTIANSVSQVCSGDAAPAFTSSALPSGGCSVATYQWQIDSGSGFTDISGATSSIFTPTAITTTTSYRRRVTDACGQIAFSNVVTITIGTPVITPAFGSNVWNVYSYNDVNYTILRGTYVENGYSASDPGYDSRNRWTTGSTPSAASGYTGCSTNLDQHGVIYMRQGFPTGTYRIDYISDDAGALYVNGTLVYSSVSWGALVTNVWTGPLNASSTIEMRWADTGGSASYGSLTFTLVTPTPLVPGTIANTSSIVCSGNAPADFTSTANASGGCYTTYQWQSSTTAPGTSGYTDIVGATSATYPSPATITATTYYRRRATDACGNVVFSNVVTVTVGVPPAPTVSFGNGQWNAYVYNARNNFIPANLFGVYTQPNTSGVNYSFDTRTQWAVASRPSLAASYSGCQVGDNQFGVRFMQTNFVTGTYQIGVQADDDVVVIINGVTVATAGGTNVWTGTLNASSQVEIRLGENNGNSFLAATFTSTTPPALTAGTIGSNQTICDNVVPAGLTSVANATSGCTITYQWQVSSTSATGPWSNTGTNSPTLSFTPPGLTGTRYYQRVATDACGRTATSNVVTVTVQPNPNNAGAITGSTTVCSGQTGVTYSIAAVTNATSYTWTLPSGSIITSGAGTNAITVTFGSTSGNVTVRPENACGFGLTSSRAITVSPAAPAPAGVITGLTSVCPGQFGVTYSIAAVTNATSYIWSFPAGTNVTAGNNTNSITVTHSTTAGSYNISVTPTNGCGNAASATTLPLTINPLPSAAGTISGPTSVCPGQTGIVYSIAAAANATSYSWGLPSGSIITSGDGTNSITVTFGSNSGNVSVTPVNACGSATPPRTLLVSVVSLGATGSISGPASVCQNQTNRVYSIPNVVGASTYAWTVPSGATITSGAGTRIITVTMGSTSGDVTVTPSNLCLTGTTSTLPVTVNLIPSAPTAGSNSPVCSGNAINLTASLISGASYTWTGPAGYTSSVQNPSRTSSTTSMSGTYNVTATVNGCTSPSASTVVLVRPTPTVPTVGSNSPVCRATTINLSASSVMGASYSWTGPNSFSSSTQNPSIASATASMTGTYNVTATLNGCTSAPGSVLVTVNDCGNIWTGATSTAWSTGSNWLFGTPPVITDSVTIPSGAPRMPILSSNQSLKALNVVSGASMIINDPSILSITSGLTVGGTLTNTGGTIEFNGSGNKYVTGNVTFNNLTVNTPASVSLNNTVVVNNTITLTQGTLVSNGRLTLNLDSGEIGCGGNGSISGNMTVTRTVSSNRTHYFAVPLDGVTVADLVDDAQVFNPLNGVSRLFEYSQSINNWVRITSGTAPLVKGRGYSLFFTAPTVMDFTGTYDHTYVHTVTLDNSNTNAKFVGNPYPITMDWDASGWTKTNINGAIYYWEGLSGQYITYNSGVGTTAGGKTADQYIPSVNGFWVQTNGTGGTATITYSRNACSANNKSFYRTYSNSIVQSLTLSNGTVSDQAIIRMDEGISPVFESDVDAYKYLNIGNSAANISTLFSDKQKSVINSFEVPKSDTILPLDISVKVNGLYTLTLNNLGVVSNNLQVYLFDSLNLTSSLMNVGEGISLTLSTTDHPNRFSLVYKVIPNTITTGVAIGEESDKYIVYSFEKTIVVKSKQEGEALVGKIITSAGEEVMLWSGSTNTNMELRMNTSLASGVYLVWIYDKDGYYVSKVVIQ
ncbi:MAG: hypothetical protein U0U66_07955 [Cytophagaceae bacterium]